MPRQKDRRDLLTKTWVVAVHRGSNPLAITATFIIVVALVALGTSVTPAQDVDDGAVEPMLYTLVATHYLNRWRSAPVC